MKTDRILWRATRSAIRHGTGWQLPAFEVEFETDAQTFKLDGEVPGQLEFMRGKDLRYHQDILKKERIVVVFVKIIRAKLDARTTPIV